MAVRVDVNPALLVWARERSGRPFEDLAGRFPKLTEWEDGQRAPTLKQLEDFARAMRTPVGYLLLQEPPDEPLPIPDFRTRGGEAIARPSPDLLDTIFQYQQRQEWYRDYARVTDEDPVPFVGSVTVNTAVPEAAGTIRETLSYGVAARVRCVSGTARASSSASTSAARRRASSSAAQGRSRTNSSPAVCSRAANSSPRASAVSAWLTVRMRTFPPRGQPSTQKQAEAGELNRHAGWRQRRFPDRPRAREGSLRHEAGQVGLAPGTQT